MAAFTTVAIVGAAVVGAAATAYAVNEQRKAAKSQQQAMERQEERMIQRQAEAKREARENAKLDAARDEAGADITLGRGDKAQRKASSKAGEGAATARPAGVANRVGGLKKKRASGEVGL